MAIKIKGGVNAASAVGTRAPARYLSHPSLLIAPAVTYHQNDNGKQDQKTGTGR